MKKNWEYCTCDSMMLEKLQRPSQGPYRNGSNQALVRGARATNSRSLAVRVTQKLAGTAEHLPRDACAFCTESSAIRSCREA
jgi:hypothetical protein